jgi:DNA (cytosine-5)-methyltransferase 1
MKIISLFSGCGGLDLGFIQAGYQVIWANEYDRSIWQTYQYNHSETYLDKRDIRNIKSTEIPDCLGIIGGPPCQSWSEAGARRGIEDSRGRLFYDYIRIVKDKQPLFFLAENVSGFISKRNIQSFQVILDRLQEIGYEISYQLINANDFDVPQDRERVIIVGYHQKMAKKFSFPLPKIPKPKLRDAITDLQKYQPIKVSNKIIESHRLLPNHEYIDTSFSSIYMSRNRVRSWDEPSFTIQAGGRHAPIHPQANKMIFVEKDKRIFDPESPMPYRRLSVRECARIQTFPDCFLFKYDSIADGYKMVGNAVPVNLARYLAKKILLDLQEYLKVNSKINLEIEKQYIQLIKARINEKTGTLVF